MEKNEKSDFNNKYKSRTRLFTINLFNSFKSEPMNEAGKVAVIQVLRSGSSIAANFFAATRARSQAEYYSKLCSVVEECDETAFWLDIIISAELIKSYELKKLEQESQELLHVFASVRKNLKEKLKISKT